MGGEPAHLDRVELGRAGEQEEEDDEMMLEVELGDFERVTSSYSSKLPLVSSSESRCSRANLLLLLKLPMLVSDEVEVRLWFELKSAAAGGGGVVFGEAAAAAWVGEGWGGGAAPPDRVARLMKVFGFAL